MVGFLKKGELGRKESDVTMKGNAANKPIIKGKIVSNQVEKSSSRTLNNDSNRKSSQKDLVEDGKYKIKTRENSLKFIKVRSWEILDQVTPNKRDG